MEKAKIRPLATPKPLNRSSPKLAWVTTSWTSLGPLNYIALPSGVFGPHIRDFPCHLGWFLTLFEGFLQLATAYTPLNGFLRKIRQKTSFRPRMCLWGGGSRWPQLIFKPLNFRKTAMLGTDFDWTVFAAENRFNMEMLQYKPPFIVTVAT